MNCETALINSEDSTATNASIVMFQSAKLDFGKNTKIIKAKNNICIILANIREKLTCSIFRLTCNGNCKIPAHINVAENIIPSGNHRIKN